METPVGQATRLKNGLVEPLSDDRELDVLRTMRTHTEIIYAKLGVNSRRAAVRRAEERGLLSRTRDR